MVSILDGEAEITISGKAFHLKAGEMITMPANKPHALKAIKQFKMMLCNEKVKLRLYHLAHLVVPCSFQLIPLKPKLIFPRISFFAITTIISFIIKVILIQLHAHSCSILLIFLLMFQ